MLTIHKLSFSIYFMEYKLVCAFLNLYHLCKVFYFVKQSFNNKIISSISTEMAQNLTKLIRRNK
jgi:hypothetical protein